MNQFAIVSVCTAKALRNTGLLNNAGLVYIFLEAMAEDEEYRSWNEIARILEIESSTFYRCLKKLRKNNALPDKYTKPPYQ